jgi:hypothetical protein
MQRKYEYFGTMYYYVPRINNIQAHGIGEYYHSNDSSRDEIIQYKNSANNGIRIKFVYKQKSPWRGLLGLTLM